MHGNCFQGLKLVPVRFRGLFTRLQTPSCHVRKQFTRLQTTHGHLRAAFASVCSITGRVLTGNDAG